MATATVGVVAALALGNAAGSQAAQAPAAARAICAATRIPCTGRWVMIGHNSAYLLGTPLTIDARGRMVSARRRVARAAAPNWGTLRNEGTGLCMSSYGTHTNGAPAHQWPCNGGRNQYWYLSIIAFYGAEIVNQGDGWCLTNSHGAASNGNVQTMWPCPGTANNRELYGYSGGQNSPISFYPRNSSFQNNGYGVSSVGNRSAGSYVEEWSANNRSRNQQWSGPVRCVPGC